MTDYTKESLAKLKEKGYKLTSTRLAVLNIVTANGKKHLTSQQIFHLVKKEYPKIGVATVYRTLHLLEEMGLIYSSMFTDDIARYEPIVDADKHKHHHLVCTQCGGITEAQEDLLDSIEKSIYENSGFEITNHSVKFYGVCKKCGDKQ